VGASRAGNSDGDTVYFSSTSVYDYATDTTTVNGMPIKVTYPGLALVSASRSQHKDVEKAASIVALVVRSRVRQLGA